MERAVCQCMWDVNGEEEIRLHNIVLKIHAALSIPYFFI